MQTERRFPNWKVLGLCTTIMTMGISALMFSGCINDGSGEAASQDKASGSGRQSGNGVQDTVKPTDKGCPDGYVIVIPIYGHDNSYCEKVGGAPIVPKDPQPNPVPVPQPVPVPNGPSPDTVSWTKDGCPANYGIVIPLLGNPWCQRFGTP
jgi:hypothetical protein